MQTEEPNGPFGAKSVAEISIDVVAPSLVRAVRDATGAWMHKNPLYPERIFGEPTQSTCDSQIHPSRIMICVINRERSMSDVALSSNSS